MMSNNKRKIVRLVLLFMLVLGYEYSQAQQDPLFSQYAFNTLSINPAYAGSKEGPSIAAISRFQWVGFDDGAPIVHSAVFHTPLSQKIGLGISLVQDNQGPTKQFHGNVDLAYHLPLSNKSHLSLGLKGGISQFRTNFDELEVRDDNDILLSGSISEAKPNIGGGVYYYSNKMYVGLSVPRLLQSEFNQNVQKIRRHYFLVGGYLARLSPTLQFRPTFLVRSVEGAPLQVDVTPSFILKDRLLLGLTYRNSPEVGAILQYWFDSGLKIGYAYDYPLSADLNRQTSGSHEIMLGFDILKNKSSKKMIKEFSPRYF